MNVTGGSTDVTTYFQLSLLADGADATGLTITDIDLQYVRSGAAPAAKVDATALAAVDSAHGDNQAIEVDATDQPGLYRVDWPDAAFAAGVKEVVLTVKCATVKTESLRVTIDAPVNVTKLGGDAQSATDLKDFADAGYDPGTNKVQGVVLVDTLTTYTSNTPQSGDAFARLGAPAGASHAADVAAVKVDTAAILVDTGTTLDGKIDTIVADTNELQTDWANGGRLDLLLDAAKDNTDYPDGFIYYSSSIGTAGTTLGTNGTIGNPSSTWADAAALAINHNFAVRCLPNETLTISSGSVSGMTIDLNGGILFLDDGVTVGTTDIISSGPTAQVYETGPSNPIIIGGSTTLENVLVNGVTLTSDTIYLKYVGLYGDVTAPTATRMIHFANCYNAKDSGGGGPVDFDMTLDGKFLLSGWYGDLSVSNMSSGGDITVLGYGKLTIDASCTGGTIRHSSHIEIVDNASGAVTTELISQAGPATEVIGGINTGAGTITTLDGLDTAQDTQHGTTQSAIADVPTIAEIVAGFGGTPGTVEDDAGNSTTVFQTNLAETADDYYNGSVLTFTSGTNVGQHRRISDYTGSTGTVTVSPAFDAEPDAADTFIIIGRIN